MLLLMKQSIDVNKFKWTDLFFTSLYLHLHLDRRQIASIVDEQLRTDNLSQAAQVSWWHFTAAIEKLRCFIGKTIDSIVS